MLQHHSGPTKRHYIVASLEIELLQLLRDHLHVHLVAAFVYLAVIVGESEGRPMSALKIASYLGIPRTTVIRRLRELTRKGIIKLLDGRYVAERPLPQLGSSNLILRAAAQLSKTDTL